jgi:hypothetical protein
MSTGNLDTLCGNIACQLDDIASDEFKVPGSRSRLKIQDLRFNVYPRDKRWFGAGLAYLARHP